MKKYEFKDLCRKGESICMNESMFDHGRELHTHDFIEITYITKGNGLYTVNNVQSNIKAGDLVTVCMMDTHQFTPLSRDFAWTNLMFLPSIVPSNCKINFSGLVLKGRNEEFSSIFKDMKFEYYNKKLGYEKILFSHFVCLLTKIARPEIDNNEQTSEITREELINLTRGFFKNSSSFSSVSLKMLADEVHVTPKYFSVLFKRKVGFTLTEFTKMIRLETAATMLCNSNSNVLSVMNYVGYKDSKFFYKEFKKRYGLTPAQYRKIYSS